MQCVRVGHHEAQLMKLSSSNKWLDHAPVYLRFWHRDWHEQDPGESAPASAKLKWNKPAFRDPALDYGRGKELRAQLDESTVSEHMLGVLADPVHDKDTNALWDTVNGLLAPVGQSFFAQDT